MKYWNKDKTVRQRCWTKVKVPNARLVGAVGGWVRHEKTPPQEMKRWCQLNGSTSKFYHYYGTDSWWFENTEDAIAFKLKWA